MNTKELLNDMSIIAEILEDLEARGLNGPQLVITRDQEQAVLEALQELKRRRDEAGQLRTLLDKSRLGDSDSNGRVERSVGEAAAMVRTLLSALEGNLLQSVPIEHPVVQWLVRYAGELIARCRVRSDGWAAFRKLNCDDPSKPFAEFGECILIQPLKTATTRTKYCDRWVEGVWLGTRFKTCEHNIGATDGLVYRAGAIKMRPREENWFASWLGAITGTPTSPSSRTSATSMSPYVKPEDMEENTHREEIAPAPDAVPEVRSFFIYRKDLDEHGHTDGCKGCRGVVRGCRGRHSEECRQSFAVMFKGDPRRRRKIDDAEERKARTVVRGRKGSGKRKGWTLRGCMLERLAQPAAAVATNDLETPTGFQCCLPRRRRRTSGHLTLRPQEQLEDSQTLKVPQ